MHWNFLIWFIGLFGLCSSWVIPKIWFDKRFQPFDLSGIDQMLPAAEKSDTPTVKPNEEEPEWEDSVNMFWNSVGK